MSKNIFVLALYFFMELAGLFSIGYGAWNITEGIWRPIFGLGLPILAATIWGIFRVPNEPHPVPPVKVSGVIRLLIEAAFFGSAVLLLYATHQQNTALIFGAVIVFLYLISYDRIIRLLKLH